MEEGDLEVLRPLLTGPHRVERLDAQAETLAAVRHRHADRLAEKAAVVAALGLGGVRECVIRILASTNGMEIMLRNLSLPTRKDILLSSSIMISIMHFDSSSLQAVDADSDV